MTIPHVLTDPDGALAYWKKRLNLSDWIIKLRLNCAPEDMRIQRITFKESTE